VTGRGRFRAYTICSWLEAAQPEISTAIGTNCGKLVGNAFGWSGDEAKPPIARHSASFAEKAMAGLDKSKAVELLNRILEAELARAVRYTHYSLLVFGFNRIPIVARASKPPSHWPMHSRPER
jgi:hypothetical protein